MPPKKPAEARLITIISGTLLPLAMSALDQTMVATALPAMRTGNSADWLLPWVIIAFLLTSSASIPLYGKLCDIYGRRKLLLIAIALFTLGSGLCALASSPASLIVARAIQGLGGGGIVPLSQTILADLVPPARRARLQTFTASTYASSMAAGPVLGSQIVEVFGWRAVFLLNIPLGCVALMIAANVLKALPRREERHPLDISGGVLLFSSCVVTLLATAKFRLDDQNWPTASELIIPAALLWLGTLLRLRYATTPIIPRLLVVNPITRLSILAAALGMGAFLTVAAFAPTGLATSHQLPADQLGRYCFPLMLAMPLGGLAQSIAAQKMSGHRYFAMSGLLLALIVSMLIYKFEHALSPPIVAALMAAFGFGIGAGVMLTTLLVQNSVPASSMGAATSTTNLVRTLSGAFFSAFLGQTIVSRDGGLSTLFGAAMLPVGIALVLIAWMGEQGLRSIQEQGNVQPEQRPV